jgi:hypothetical protein
LTIFSSHPARNPLFLLEEFIRSSSVKWLRARREKGIRKKIQKSRIFSDWQGTKV